MEHNARKLLALLLALTMLLSMFAVASGEQDIIDLGGEIVIEGETDTDGETQGDAPDEEGGVELELDGDEGLPDGEVDPAGGEDLNLGLDLNGVALESDEAALAPETEAAMNAGDPTVISLWADLKTAL